MSGQSDLRQDICRRCGKESHCTCPRCEQCGDMASHRVVLKALRIGPHGRLCCASCARKTKEQENPLFFTVSVQPLP